MSIVEIIVLGIGLAMDAVAVSMANGMVYRDMTKLQYVSMPVFFGVFQAGMPLLGYFAGSFFVGFIDKYSGIVILIILGVIGGKMLKEGVSHYNGTQVRENKQINLKVLLLQAIVTSIDAFAIGVAFLAVNVNLVAAVTIIGLVTVVMVSLAVLIGRSFGDFLGSKAEILGGIILIIIGIKAII